MSDSFDTFKKGQPNLMICVPAYGGSIITETTMSLIQLSQALMQHNIGCKFGTLSFPNITDVRNIFTSIWYDKTPISTHMLMVDADMSFTPELILDMLNSEHPLVGIIPVKKKYPIEFVGRANLTESEPVNGYLSVDGVGAGILLFSREVMSEMLLKMPEIVSKYPIDKHPASELILAQGLTRLIRPFDAILSMEIGELSEDLSFSRRWKYGCGGEIWANISHAVGHIGRHEFSACYQDFLAAKKEAETKAAEAQAAAEALKQAAE